MLDRALNLNPLHEELPESLSGGESLDTLIGFGSDDMLAGDRDIESGDRKQDPDWLLTDTKGNPSAPDDIEAIGRQCGVEIEEIPPLDHLSAAMTELILML
jgi:hypothetical protein